MRAAVYHGVGDIRLEELPEPVAGPGQVKIKVAHNGVCGTDLHEYFSATTFIPTEPHPQTGVVAPVVIGHEFAGTVVEVGAGVASVTVGQRAALRPNYACGKCPSCTGGLPNICRLIGFHGLSGPGGGLSEYTVVEAGMVHPLPPNVSLELGALVEPMAVAHHAVDRAELSARDTVVVLGSGPIGIGLWFALRGRGIERILISETSPDRRAAISRLGATNVIDPRTDDLVEAVMRLSDHVGAAAVFDAAGVGAAIEQSLPALAARGRVVVVGIHEQPFSFNPTSLLLQEVELIGSLIYDDEDYRSVIHNMATGLYDTGGWVEHAPLSDLLDAYAELRAGRKMKILVDLH